jgi:hypothetical protein
MQAVPDDRALSVVDRHPGRTTPEPFEGAAMTGQPRLDGLVQNDFGVLMPGPAQGHDEYPGLERDTGLVCEHGAGTEVDLDG